jgi:hypothetical protein
MPWHRLEEKMKINTVKTPLLIPSVCLGLKREISKYREK